MTITWTKKFNFKLAIVVLTHFLSLASLSLASASSAAGNFDFLPASTGAEKEFQSLVEKGNFRQALLTWPTAHERYSKSDNGKAFYAYLLLQNGLPFLGLDSLLNSTEPKSLHPDLIKIWNTELTNSILVQKGWVSASGGWKNKISAESPKINIRNKADIKKAFVKVNSIPKEQLNLKARSLFNLAVGAALINEIDSALKAIKLLKDSSQTAFAKDFVTLTYARLLYQKSDLAQALEQFNQIAKSSEYWVDALEARAWISLRENKYDQTLGHITTLTSPALDLLVGPEAYFMANLASLKTCDYPRIFKTSELFKTRHRARLVAIEQLATTGSNKDFALALSKLEKDGATLSAIGPLVASLPRGSLRDSAVIRLIESQRQLTQELTKAQSLTSELSALGGESQLAKISERGRILSERFKFQAKNRLRTLAKNDVKEYQTYINKLHIIEGEVIQRLHVDDNLKGKRNDLAQVKDEGDVLVFPHSTDEVWIDELDNYKARVKDCPRLNLKGASL